MQYRRQTRESTTTASSSSDVAWKVTYLKALSSQRSRVEPMWIIVPLLPQKQRSKSLVVLVVVEAAAAAAAGAASVLGNFCSKVLSPSLFVVPSIHSEALAVVVV